MSLKRIQDVLNYLEKVKKENFNIGKDKREVFLKDLFEKYTYYNMDLDEEYSDFREKPYKLIEKFASLKSEISRVSKDYLKFSLIYISFLNDRIGNESSFLVRGNMKKVFEKENEENLIALCKMIKLVLEQTGVLNYSISAEQKALGRMGLDDFLSEEFIKKDKSELLSEKKIKRGDNDQLEIKALCMFWANKLTKVMENCMLGYLFEQTLKSDYDMTDVNIRNVTMQQKNIVFLKFDLMRAIWEYCEKKFPKISHRDDLLKQYLLHSKFQRGKISREEYEKIVREKDFVRSNETFEEFLEAMNLMPKDFTKLFMEVESKYNEMFTGESKEESFFQDFNVLLNMYGAQNSLYEIKDQLAHHILFTIVSYKHHKKTLPYLIKNWGISEDKRNMYNKYILYLELRGYMKPLSIHLGEDDFNLYKELIKDVPSYQSVFKTPINENNSYLAVNYLFKVSDAQKTKLKKTIKEKAAIISSAKGKVKKMADDDKSKAGMRIYCMRMENELKELEAMREIAGPKTEIGR